MESTGSRELIKSISIVAGIPLAFSVACSLFAWITEKKNSSLSDQIQETKTDCMFIDDEDNTRNANHLKEHIFTLKSKIEEIQDLVREIEVRFFQFIELKDKEYVLMEVLNTLRIEKERVEFFQKEVSSMEEENKKCDDMVIKYLKALEELEFSRLKNNVLQRKENKLLKKMKEGLRLIVKFNVKIKAQEADLLSKEVELEKKDIVIKGLERQVEEMSVVIERLNDDKNEVYNRLETIENEVTSKAESHQILVDNYNRVVHELENIKNDRLNELKELIYLRWCHACLRHELERRKELEQQPKHDEETVNTHGLGLVLGPNVAPEESKEHESDNESLVHQGEPFFGSGKQHTKRRWLVTKFKKWVDGNPKHHEAICFGSHPCVNEAK